MSEDPSLNPGTDADSEGTGSAALQEPVDLDLNLQAFVSRNLEMYYHYICTRVGTGPVALQLPRETLAEIAAHWDQLCRGKKLDEDTWNILRCAVDFHWDQTRRLLESRINTLGRLRASARAQDSAIGLYEALPDLTERELDVLLLRKVMGYDTRHTAWALGIDDSTVDRALARARARLEFALKHRRILRPGNGPERT